MGNFGQGVLAGKQASSNNPFNILLSSFKESQARRYKEDQGRKKEEFELEKSLNVLNQDFLYKKELEKVIGEEKRKTLKTKSELGVKDPIEQLIEELSTGGGASRAKQKGTNPLSFLSNFFTGGQSRGQTPTSPLETPPTTIQDTTGAPQGITEADIAFTLSQHPELTREELLKRLGR